MYKFLKFKGRGLQILKTKIMRKLSVLDWIALILLVIGGLNWGLVGLFSFDLVATIFGDMSTVSRIIYILVGLSGIYILFSLGKLAKK